MKRAHVLALAAVLATGLGGFALLVGFELAANPRLLYPFCAGLFLLLATVAWELLLKPASARREAYRNLRGLVRGQPEAPRARKVRRSPAEQPVPDAGREPTGVPPELREHE